MPGRFTIFYVDDDADDLDFFREVTNAIPEKIELFTHEHAETFLGALHNPPPTPNIIFLDLNMPGKSGFDVLKEIKSSEGLKEIPVVAFTTSNDPMNISKCLKLGASYFITKPSSFKMLKQSIEHTLKIDWKNFHPSAKDFIYRQA